MRARPADEDEVTRPAADDVTALLVANHKEFLAFLTRRLGDPTTAEDVLQEAFARGIARLGSLREHESAKAWFYRTLRNAVVDHYRRRGSSQRALDKLARELEEVPDGGDELHAAVCQCVKTLAATLKPEYARALQRVEIDGLAVKDYAAEEGISPSNGGVRVHRAREALRRQVVASCGSCAEHGCLDCSCGR